MTSDINLQVAASQRLASSTTKAREAVTSEQTSKPDPKPTAEEKRELSIEQLNEAVEQLNTLAQNVRRELNFSVDDETGRTVITVKDRETDEVIRKIPSDEVLNLISRLLDSEGGLLEEIV